MQVLEKLKLYFSFSGNSLKPRRLTSTGLTFHIRWVSVSKPIKAALLGIPWQKCVGKNPPECRSESGQRRRMDEEFPPLLSRLHFTGHFTKLMVERVRDFAPDRLLIPQI